MIERWRIVMTNEIGIDIDLDKDLSDTVTEEIDELIESNHVVSWTRDMTTKLPKEVMIPTRVMIDGGNGECGAVADYLSDEYGFCVISLSIENDMAVDIVWDMTD